MSRYFLDCEFIERSPGPTSSGEIHLISIGVVCEDGREFHGVVKSAPFGLADQWVKDNVIAKLPPKEIWLSRINLAKALKNFITSPTEFWTWFGAYDWVLFCWACGGKMLDLPRGWPQFHLDLRQEMYRRRLYENALPPKPVNAHDALIDARWNRDVWKKLIPP